MPYKHLNDVHEHIKNAPEDIHINHLKYHDLHEQPADHETGHLMSVIAELKAGEPFSAHYPGPTVGYVIEGEMEGEDKSKPGEKFIVKKGDVLHLEADTHLTWKTTSVAKVLGVTYVSTTIKSVADLIVRE